MTKRGKISIVVLLALVLLSPVCSFHTAEAGRKRALQTITCFRDKTYKAYVKSPKSLLMKSRFIRKTEPDSVWAGIRELSDRIDTVPHDYDPAIFVNAYELIASQKRK